MITQPGNTLWSSQTPLSCHSGLVRKIHSPQLKEMGKYNVAVLVDVTLCLQSSHVKSNFIFLSYSILYLKQRLSPPNLTSKITSGVYRCVECMRHLSNATLTA